MPTNRDELLTAAQAADVLGVHRRTVIRWAKSGRLPTAQKLPGSTGTWLFSVADVEAMRGAA